MNKFKRFCLLLCCSLVCLNGFLPVVSYAADEIFFLNDRTLSFRSKEWFNKATFKPVDYNVETDFYTYNTSAYDSMYGLMIGSNSSAFFSDIVYLPDRYDYYMIITAYSDVPVDQFSFAPDYVSLWFQNCDHADEPYLTDLKYYHHDKEQFQTGFTVAGKIPELTSTSLSNINLHDVDCGSLPEAAMYIKVQVVEVDKDNNMDFLSALYDKLDNINTSINQQGADIQSAINQGLDELQRTIEEQYSVSDEEDFGVTDIVNQVNEKAGVLSFGTDTLVNFLDLFDAANATNTKLTFPGFSMKIQGVDYQVWPDYHYDLSELENQFGALIEVVRWGCVMCVWLAVLNYLVKAYDTIFGR